MERGDLRVRRQIARINGEVVEAPLKTKNAYRTLPLAEDTIGVLGRQGTNGNQCRQCSLGQHRTEIALEFQML